MADAVTDAAIGWLVQLRSGEATAADRAAFDAWLARDARHRQAWERLAGPVDGAFGIARAAAARVPAQADAVAAALARVAAQNRQRRRVLRGALALAGVGASTALVAERFVPLEHLLADHSTGTGARASFALADGSSLLLNARSAADSTVDAEGRLLRLRNGACIATVQADALRPFEAQCRDGSVQVAAGTSARFLLRQDATRSLAVALQGRIALASADDAAHALLVAGEASWLTPAALAPAPETVAGATGWQQGRFIADDQPLGDVVDALRAYRPGVLRMSPQAARLRVYGSYPLDDSDRALAILADTLPVVVHRHSGGWLVRIEAA